MLRKLPPLTCLLALEAVARLGSFGAAAQELCITRSAVSHRIKVLEEYFGVTLLAGKRGSIRLGSEGRQLVDAVTSSLASLEQACHGLTTREAGTVRVNAGLAFASSWLMKRLDAFHRAHPDVDLQISALHSRHDDKLACLHAREADIVITHGTARDWEGLEYREIMKSKLFPVASANYVESVGGLPDPPSLLRATLLRLPRQPWRPWFRAAGLVCQEPTRGPLFSHAGLMIDAAVNGQGIGLVRDVLVTRELRSGALVRLCSASVETTYSAVYRREATSKPEVGAFLDWLCSAACVPGDERAYAAAGGGSSAYARSS